MSNKKPISNGVSQKFLTGQAVILAAGEGTRLRPLTLTKPKPLLPIANTYTLKHNLEQLPAKVREVILIVGYKKEIIRKEIGESFKGMKIRYVAQERQRGTGDAAKKAAPFLENRFLLLYGDDLYDKEDIKRCIFKNPSVSLKRVENPSNFGVVVVRGKKVIKLAEKPKKPLSNLVNSGLYFLDKSIFNFKIKKSKRGEYEFTDYLKQLIEENKLYFSLAKNWLPISQIWNLFDANELLLSKISRKISGKIEKNVTLKGKVIVEKGTEIKSGSYVEGPVYIGENCQIGPNSFIRPSTSIQDNCKIGQAVEIKNSIIGKNTKIPHLSYVGDSIIGENCNLAAGTTVANLRHDNNSIKTVVKGVKVDTGRRKFGTVIGNNVKTGIGTLIYPGRKIWPGKTTLPGEIIKKDIV